jgi:hypothetical protein
MTKKKEGSAFWKRRRGACACACVSVCPTPKQVISWEIPELVSLPKVGTPRHIRLTESGFV